MILINDDYKRQLQEMHLNPKKFANGTKKLKTVRPFLEKYKPQSIIDFGCSHGGLITAIQENFSMEATGFFGDPRLAGTVEHGQRPICRGYLSVAHVGRHVDATARPLKSRDEVTPGRENDRVMRGRDSALGHELRPPPVALGAIDPNLRRGRGVSRGLNALEPLAVVLAARTGPRIAARLGDDHARRFDFDDLGLVQELTGGRIGLALILTWFDRRHAIHAGREDEAIHLRKPRRTGEPFALDAPRTGVSGVVNEDEGRVWRDRGVRWAVKAREGNGLAAPAWDRHSTSKVLSVVDRENAELREHRRVDATDAHEGVGVDAVHGGRPGEALGEQEAPLGERHGLGTHRHRDAGRVAGREAEHARSEREPDVVAARGVDVDGLEDLDPQERAAHAEAHRRAESLLAFGGLGELEARVAAQRGAKVGELLRVQDRDRLALVALSLLEGRDQRKPVVGVQRRAGGALGGADTGRGRAHKAAKGAKVAVDGRGRERLDREAVLLDDRTLRGLLVGEVVTADRDVAVGAREARRGASGNLGRHSRHVGAVADPANLATAEGVGARAGDVADLREQARDDRVEALGELLKEHGLEECGAIAPIGDGLSLRRGSVDRGHSVALSALSFADATLFDPVQGHGREPRVDA